MDLDGLATMNMGATIADGAGISPDAVLRFLDERGLSALAPDYAAFHAPRYAYLLRMVRELTAGRDASALSLLDVGPGFQTELLRGTLPGAVVNTLGFTAGATRTRSPEQHFEFDLNRAYDSANWPHLPDHDVVVLAEVIEHLSTSPVAVYEGLAGALKPRGYLVVQTPNAAALAKRVRAVAGRPVAGPRGEVVARGNNPGHFREYVAAELESVGLASGLEPVKLELTNYFLRPNRLGRAYSRTTAWLPRSLREGITAVYRRQ